MVSKNVQRDFQRARIISKRPTQAVLGAMSLQKQSNQLINDPGVRNTHRGKQVLWESIHHTLFCVTPADVLAREQHNTFSAQTQQCNIEHINLRSRTAVLLDDETH